MKERMKHLESWIPESIAFENLLVMFSCYCAILKIIQVVLPIFGVMEFREIASFMQ